MKRVLIFLLFIISCSNNYSTFEIEEGHLSDIEKNKIKVCLAEIKRGEKPGINNLKIANVYYDNRMFVESLKYYETAVKNIPPPVQDNIKDKLIDLYLRLEKYNKAEEFINYMISVEPDNQKNYIILSEIYIKLKEFTKAIKVLRDNEVKFEDNSSLLLQLGRVYLKNKDFYSAEKIFTRLEQNEDNKYAAYYYKSMIFLKLGELEKAKAGFLDLIKKDEGSEYAGLSYKELSKLALRDENIDKAVELLKKAKEIIKNDVETRMLLSKLYKSLNKYLEAVEELRNLKYLVPNDPEIRKSLGLLLIERFKDYKNAVEELEAAKKILINDMELMLSISDCYIKLENYAFAIKNLKQIIELDPLSPYSKKAFFALGTIYTKLKYYDSAINEYETGKKYFPDYYVYYFNAGNLYDDKGYLQKAELNYLQCIKLKPDFVNAYTNLGNIYFKMNLLDEASKYYDIAYNRFRSKEAGYNLAKLKEFKKKKYEN